MVYVPTGRVNFLILSFILIFFKFCYKYTIYHTYILSINYWETNFFFLIVIFLAISSTILQPYNFLFYMFFISISALSQNYPFKLLINNLIVGTVTIHPFLFYCFTVVSFFKFFFKKYFNLVAVLKVSRVQTFLFLTFTLMLGGIWSTQSASWGYFWVNDSVEWLLLSIIILVLFRLHFLDTNINCLNVYLYPLVILNFLIFVRLNFLPTRHNFITNTLTFVSITFFYLFFFFFFLKGLNLTHNIAFILYPAMLLIFYAYLSSYLVFYKFFFIFLFFIFFKPQYYIYTKKFITHLLFISVLILWCFFFPYFTVNYTNSCGNLTIEPLLFNNIFWFSHFLSYDGRFLFYLESCNFFITNFIPILSILFKNLKIITTLNNFYFLILLFLFVIFKKVWI